MKPLAGLTDRVVVLCYHAIADHSEDPVLARWSVPPELLRRQLDALAASGWEFVDLDQTLAIAAGEARGPRKAMLLTFDDGYCDLLTEALPALRRHAAPAVAFAVAGHLGGDNAWDQAKGARPLKLLDAGGLREASAAGVRVESHTSDHRPLTSVPDEEMTAELAGAADRLAEVGLPRPVALAYPFGDYDDRVAGATAAAGYAAAFTIEAGAVRPGHDPYRLPRIIVVSGDSPRSLRLKAAIAHWPARWRFRVQRALRLSG